LRIEWKSYWNARTESEDVRFMNVLIGNGHARPHDDFYITRGVHCVPWTGELEWTVSFFTLQVVTPRQEIEVPHHLLLGLSLVGEATPEEQELFAQLERDCSDQKTLFVESVLAEGVKDEVAAFVCEHLAKEPKFHS